VLLRLRPDLPREQRRPVHHAIDAATQGQLGTKTVHDCPTLENATILDNSSSSKTTTSAIQVHWSPAAQRRVRNKRQNCNESQQHHQHQLCVLRKRRCEHSAALRHLAAALHCRVADLGLAGIKDRSAVTYQFVTVGSSIGRSRILKAKDALQRTGRLTLEPLGCRVPRALQKGSLVGNRFEIVVRNLERVVLDGCDGVANERWVPADAAHVEHMVERLRSGGGFVNFYGEQRVGDPGPRSLTGVRSFDVGRAMLQQNWWEAIDLLLTGRRLVHGVAMTEETLEPFRRTWCESGGDVEATIKVLPKDRHTVPKERAILKGLKRYGKDKPLSVLQCLSRNERTFYINAVSHLVVCSGSFNEFT